jgi:hypothetical protein
LTGDLRSTLKSTKGSPFLMDMSCNIPLWSPTTICMSCWNRTNNFHKWNTSTCSTYIFRLT